MVLLLTATVLCGGLALRAVGQVNHWMDNDYLNCPLFLTKYRNIASVQVVLTNLLTLPSAVVIGWSQYRWLGATLTPLATWVAHLIFASIFSANRPATILQARLFNPIYHLFLLPYILLTTAIWTSLHG